MKSSSVKCEDGSKNSKDKIFDEWDKDWKWKDSTTEKKLKMKKIGSLDAFMDFVLFCFDCWID